MNLGNLQLPKTTSESVADSLRSAILRGQFHDGQALRQDVIAAELNVSKIPVREALVQLQGEGLVKLIPSRGAVVTSLSPEQIAEIYVMRLTLEPLALQKAIPNYTQTHFSEFDHLLSRIDYETDLAMWVELNGEFHTALYRPSEMHFLLQTIQILHNNVVRYIGTTYLDEDYRAHSQGQHREIVDHCKAGQPDAACAALVTHLEDASDTLRDLKQPDQ